MNEETLELLVKALDQLQEQTARIAELVNKANQVINNQNTNEQ